jgi:hypothetical protein
MKAITLTQPWATLVAIGAKRIETRSWRTDYRGPLAIHAAKGATTDVIRLAFGEPFKSVLNVAGYKLFSSCPRGALVATCQLVDCVRITNKREIYGYIISMGYNVVIPPDHPECDFGDYTPGRFAWLLSDVQELPKPVPARGALGLWECAL